MSDNGSESAISALVDGGEKSDGKPMKKSRSTSSVVLKDGSTGKMRRRSASGSRRRRNSMLKRVRVSHSNEVFLKNAWTFWYDEQPQKGMGHVEYESSVIRIGTFDTIQDFWRYYNNIVDPNVFPSYSNLRMFKANIKPLWEDPANSKGGKWSIPVPKGETGKCWIRVILFVIANQLTHIDDVCGIVLSVRPQRDTIQIWHRTSSDRGIVDSITREVTDLLQSAKMESSVSYVTHGKKAQARKARQRTQSTTASHADRSDDNGGVRRSTSLSDRVGGGKHRRAPSEDLELDGEEESFPLEFDENGLIKARRSSSVSEMAVGKKVSKHKKSESMSGSPFGGSSVRQHRKSRSDSNSRRCAIPLRAMGSGAKVKVKPPCVRMSASEDVVRTAGFDGPEESDREEVNLAASAEDSRAGMPRNPAKDQMLNSNLENLYSQIYKRKPGLTPLNVAVNSLVRSPPRHASDSSGLPRRSLSRTPSPPAISSRDLASVEDDEPSKAGGSPWFLLNLAFVVLMIAVPYLVYIWFSPAADHGL